jgi:eukaryotic-like serine/threonine-protein kinase
MWHLGVHGFITTNLDRFATTSSVDANILSEVCEFDGRESGDYAWILRKPQKFVLNIHGRLESESSWVLTAEDLSNLKKLPGYRALLESLMRDSIILFAGCSADDVSIAAHLENLKGTNLKFEGHYWLTERNDQTADHWAEENGLSRIFFDAQGDCFDGIDEFLTELKRFNDHDEPPPIIVPPSSNKPATSATTPDVLLTEPSVNKVRQILNDEAKRILTSDKPELERKKEYAQFTTKYEEALHRAWFISTSAGSELFDLQISETLKKGAFGQVYEAIDPVGNRVAVKVLHGNVKDDPTMLTCFRRGVAAMRLLSEYKVDGVVPYLKAWEIPTCAVMDLINGVNLQEAIERGQVRGWYEILRISQTLVKIIKAAHSTPAGVLHRDLRPANIMLDSKEEALNRKVLVLDFDLCWHHDALDAASLHLNAEANNGYLSPEQLDPSRHHLTRKPLVDSFGLGMIFYYLIARKHPVINQYMFKTWREVLLRLAVDHPCKEWESAPMRYIRLIEHCTLNEQSARWDIARILGETQLLLEVVSGRRDHITAEFLAEELFCRVDEIIGRYDLLPEREGVRFQPRDGYEIFLRWNERDRTVALKVQWLQTGSYRFETLRKYIGESTEVAAKELRAGLWNEVRTSLATGGLTIDASIKTEICADNAMISKAADALALIIENLRKLATRAS